MINVVHNEDCLTTMSKMEDESINMVMTSPPYWALRDYGTGQNQLGLEPTFDLYISHLCDIFDEVKRVLRKDGTCWVNLGDTYCGSGKGAGGDISNSKEVWTFKEKVKKTCSYCGKEFNGYAFQQFCGASCSGVDNTPRSKKGELPTKSLTMIPYRFAIEMVNRGWILRNTIIWHKRNCMPSSAKDRFTVDFEYMFFFVKNKKYFFNQQFEPSTYTDSRKDKGNIPYENRLTNCNVKVSEERNKRTVWTINPKPFKEAHFAVYPEELCETPIKSGCPEGGIVYDPFFGSGTTGLVAHKLNRKFIGSEISKEYCKIAEKRLVITKQIQFI